MTRPKQRPALVLALFALAGSALVAITHGLTRDDIAASRQSQLRQTLHALVPEDTFDNDPVTDRISRTDRQWLGTAEPVEFHRGRRDGRPVVLFGAPVAPDGYSGEIRLLAGVYADGRLAGVRILEHRETPGLGDRIERERSNWILEFDGRSVENTPPSEWQVRRDGGAFDQFTGATITPRSVVRAVHRFLQYVEHNPELFTAPAEPPP